MADEPTGSASSAQRLDEIIAAYVQAAEAGHAPDRQALLARHLDLAAELAEFFADQDRFARLAAPLRAMMPPARAEKPDPAAGARVGYFGDYELLGEVGRGSMGVVFKARQRSLNRTVALKMIRASRTASDVDVQRFRAEAEAVANLDHPHIIPIYETGDFQGDYYFTMKLLDGGNLAGVLHREPWTPGNKERQRWAARLLVPVARAIHHAHERGILHRDLKPANILLDARGEPHVTDFGLARRLQGDAGLTESGTVVGTPSYMAPEQAAGRRRELTTAADVYSLGAILYEMLTGRPPFRAETTLETLRQVVEQEPVAPRKIDRAVNRDLETICLKCLEKDPRRRYGSAEELAEELERFLADRPIRGRRSSLLRGLTRFGRRRWVAVFVIIGLLLAFLLFTATRVAVVRQRQAAMEAMAWAEQQRHRAEESLQQARRAVDALFTQVGEDELREGPKTDALRRELLQQALRYYEQLAEAPRYNERMMQAPGKDPEARRKIAQAQRRIGAIQEQLGRYAEAEEAYRRAIAVATDLAKQFPAELAYQQDLAAGFRGLGSVLKATGRLAEAEQTYRRAVDMQELLATTFPKIPDYRLGLALALRGLAEIELGVGKVDEGERLCRRSYDLLTALVGEFPHVAAYRDELGRTRTILDTRHPRDKVQEKSRSSKSKPD
jgi:tetratricopeptide (TPR) repeat protein/tRNA A-37 threonylcarbamoyl transferase component Bud32